MAKYIFVYKGPATDMSDMSEEQSKAVMEAWTNWMQKVGTSLVDIGQPMANSVSIVDNGTEGTAALLNGYSIVEAENIDAAKNLADGHPFLSEGKGNFAIDIFELMPVPM
jgi:hypothetical protein